MSRRRARDLLGLGIAVESEQANAQLIGARDVALVLDGVPVADPVRRRAAASTMSISATEAVSKHEPSESQERKHLGRRVGLHRVEHAACRATSREGMVVLADDVEVDDEDRAFIGPLAEEIADAPAHHGASPQL